MKITGARIRAVSASVPAQRRGQADQRVARFVGIAERRVAPEGVLPSDLNLAAALPLLDDFPKESIDCLIHITQSPDYTAPTTSCILHEKLALPITCAALDAVQGCSAYVYGLWMASCILASGGARRVLLLVGDTVAIPLEGLEEQDKATEPLFGDAGSATILDADPSAPPMYYTNGTDGRGWDCLIIPGSGRRQPGATMKVQMRGAEVFEFTLRCVPELARSVMEDSGTTVEQFGSIICHQANRVILDSIQKKIGATDRQFVRGLEHFGNTGGPSVALAIVTERVPPGLWMLLGFGVGLSWSGAAIDASGVRVYPLVEVP